MIKKVVALMLISYLLVPALVWGQEDYRLGAEDEIQIRVWDHDDLTRNVRVGLNGDISFPFIGQIKARGLTVQDLQQEMERRLGPKYIIDPHVSITVTDYKSQKYFVVGNVQKPGTYPLVKPIKVIEAISQAGGIASGSGSRPLSGAVAIIVRAQPGQRPKAPQIPDNLPESQKTIVSLSDALAGNPSQNIEIKNGDTIYVPNLVYYVTGEVKSPNRYPFEEDMTVLMAVTTAGGFTDKASRGRTYIIRGRPGDKHKVKVGLEDLIHPGDTIVVPESWF